ncbi:MAG: hypothetical protein L0H93_02090 [Nocardioides sp.]|nr:hypothetical protein [Nocardioides sp.]
MNLEVGTFTDVRAEEAVTGFDGFQFQSVSADFIGEDMALVQGELNFVPAPAWAAAHGGDETSHPMQCSYAERAGRYYLTKSRALGRTISGRPGNQLTEAAVTASADDLAPYSPAQLMSAKEWTLAKAPEKQRPAWVTPLEIDESFEDAALEDHVRDDAWLQQALPVIVTMLESSLEEGGNRVFVQHSDLDEVLRLIAIGSLLLDPAAVRRLSFRAFHQNPWNGDFRVVGVHPELSTLIPTADWKNTPAASWIDLEAREIGEIEVSDSADAAVRWMLEYGLFRARGAIQMRQQLVPLLGAVDGTQVAELLSWGMEASAAGSSGAARAVARLAVERQSDLLETYQDEFVDAITMRKVDDEKTFAAAADTVRALLDAGHFDMAAEITLPMLESLAAEPRFSGTFALGIASATVPMAWSDAEAQEQASLAWGTALRDAPPVELAALFSATGRLGLVLEGGLLEPAADRLVEQWIDEPTLGTGREAWYASRAIEGRLVDLLVASLDAGDPVRTRAFFAGEWDSLLGCGHQALDAWGQARDIAQVPIAERASELKILPRGALPGPSRRLILGEQRLPLDAKLWASAIQVFGVDESFSEELLTLFRQEVNSPRLARHDGSVTQWRTVVDALMEEERSGAELLQDLHELLGTFHRVRSARADALHSVDAYQNAALASGRRTARLSAMDDLPGTGRLILEARDRGAVAEFAAELGAVAGQSVDAFLELQAEMGRAVAAGQAALRVYAVSDGELRRSLGESVRGLLERHREIERKSRKHEDIMALIEQVKQEHKTEGGGTVKRIFSKFKGQKR